MARPSITLDDHIADPYFCEDETDFYKLVIGHVGAISENTEDAIVMTTGIRVICHEYLSLVLSKKIEPYEMGKKWVNEEMPGFKEMINIVNEKLMKSGAPIKEGVNGKIDIDYEALKKEVEDEEEK